jgi:AraC-like DNA-binding protein
MPSIRIGYVINLVYGPLFFGYFKKTLGSQSSPWSSIALWVLAGISLPFLRLGQGFYVTLLLISLFANLAMSLTLALKGQGKDKLTNWHRFALVFFSLLALTYAYEMLIGPYTTEAAWLMRFAYFSELLFLSGGFLFFSFRNPTHFLHIRVLNVQRIGSKPADPTVGTEVSLIIHELERGHLYRNPELTRTTLTKLTGISPNRISELINGYFGINFSEWINTYRINEARELLISQEADMTVKEIYYHVGFNSKSAFYGAFKKHTDLTPSLYRQGHHSGPVRSTS